MIIFSALIVTQNLEDILINFGVCFSHISQTFGITRTLFLNLLNFVIKKMIFIIKIGRLVRNYIRLTDVPMVIQGWNRFF